MEAYTEDQKHYMVSSIIGLFYKLYDPHQTGIVGPRLEHGIRNAMLTVMSEPGNTFIEVQRALTDTSFVQALLPKVNDPIVRRYWTDQIAQTNDFHKSEVLDYIVSKFGRFIKNGRIWKRYNPTLPTYGNHLSEQFGQSNTAGQSGHLPLAVRLAQKRYQSKPAVLQ